MNLRDYQLNVLDQLDAAIAQGQRKLLLVAPTGSGKTVIASEFIRRRLAEYKRTVFLAHRREIIDQTSHKLTLNDVYHGIILAKRDDALRPQALVQVASIGTLWSRAFRGECQKPDADIIIVDEAHHARAKTYQKIIAAYPDAIVLGMTATPCRGDGRGLGNVFDVMIEAPQIPELIGLGFLVGTQIYAPVAEDVASGVRTEKGDYVVSALSTRMDTDALVGDIVTHWARYGQNKPTVVFAVDVAHSAHIASEFVKAGVKAEHLDGSTPLPDREAILNRLRSGETKIVSNCMVLTEGWDMPAVGCCILARPTKQIGLYLQMIGRVLRPAEGKERAIILDHSGGVYRHGRPEDQIEWTLDVDARAVNKEQERRKRGEAMKVRECPSCQHVLTVVPCWQCGWEPKPYSRGIDFADGELGLVEKGVAEQASLSRDQKQDFYRELLYIQAERKYKTGWAAHQFKEKCGQFPPWLWNDFAHKEPGAFTLGWVRHRQIAYAKRRRAA